MNVEETMSAHGFRLSAGCSGEAFYTKFIQSGGKRAYVSVTTLDGSGFPTSLEDPVREVVYELKSGEELFPGKNFQSLSVYLDSIEK
ncbi:MAG: hypothetical protein P4L43_18225 [Syntrophobacteraceae bacterium]|nr:hypothetical protein [Syntrophobacteraceae bacterium]